MMVDELIAPVAFHATGCTVGGAHAGACPGAAVGWAAGRLPVFAGLPPRRPPQLPFGGAAAGAGLVVVGLLAPAAWAAPIWADLGHSLTRCLSCLQKTQLTTQSVCVPDPETNCRQVVHMKFTIRFTPVTSSPVVVVVWAG